MKMTTAINPETRAQRRLYRVRIFRVREEETIATVEATSDDDAVIKASFGPLTNTRVTTQDVSVDLTDGPWCSRCGDGFHGEVRDCPDPVPGTPLVDCGRGGHWFSLTDPRHFVGIRGVE